MSDANPDGLLYGEGSFFQQLKNEYGDNCLEGEVECLSSAVAVNEVLESSATENTQYDEAAQITSTVALSLEEVLENIELKLSELDEEVNLSKSIEIGDSTMLHLGITVEELMPGLSKKDLNLAREDIKSKIGELVRRFLEMIMNALGALSRYFRSMFGEYARIKKQAQALQREHRKATRHSPKNSKIKVGVDFGVLSTDIKYDGDQKVDKAANAHNTNYLWKLLTSYIYLTISILKELSEKTVEVADAMTTTVENADIENLTATLEVLNATAFAMVSSKETEAFFTRLAQDGKGAQSERVPVLTFTQGKPEGNVAIKNSEIIANNKVIQLQNIMLDKSTDDDALTVAAAIQESGMRLTESSQKYRDETGTIEPVSPTIVGEMLALIIDYCDSINEYNSTFYPKLEQKIQKYAKTVRELGSKVGDGADTEENRKLIMSMTRYTGSLKQWSTRIQADLIRLSRVVLSSYINVCEKSIAEFTE